MSSPGNHISRWVLSVATLSFLLQIAWFGYRCFHQIDIDGIDYIGIARHLRSHQWYCAIDDFRSPLLSWLLAALSFVNPDFLSLGKLINITSYLLCGALLYIFTLDLWHSKSAASLAVLWFSFCRGLSAQAVAMVTPDFFLAAITLLYFIWLLRCVNADKKKYWLILGVLHAIAFLAKAFALPWLALTTLVAALLPKPRQRWALRLVLAGILPVVAAISWSTVLHSKYGVFTTGTQFKFNFMQWTSHKWPRTKYVILNDTSPFIDGNNVNDPMPPGSWLWIYKISFANALPDLAKHEATNLPKALKELFIVVTPGGVLGFVFGVWLIAKRRSHARDPWIVATVVTVALASLLFTYCLLVFDSRYLYPVIPLMIAVTMGCFFPFPNAGRNSLPPIWTMSLQALIVAGIVFSLAYPSSPYRTVDRDFQVACYRAGSILRSHPGATVVSLGNGPYPEHGVGWEAGYKAAYFGNRRLIAVLNGLPNVEDVSPVLGDIAEAAPDATLLWGEPKDERYRTLAEQLRQTYGNGSRESLLDPSRGEVGVAFFRAR